MSVELKIIFSREQEFKFIKKRQNKGSVALLFMGYSSRSKHLIKKFKTVK